MKRKILVTSYNNPDLDGIACAYGYAELLQSQGEDAKPAIFGSGHKEAQFVLNRFDIPSLPNAKEIITQFKKIVLVDTSNIKDISSFVNPKHVIEIIDHRQVHQLSKFPNATVEIEMVGAAATLIAEKFYKLNVQPSHHAAVLLYSAIVSNTVNFQADVTTSRDKKIAEFLKNPLDLAPDYIHNMFTHKSELNGPLRGVFEHDLVLFSVNSNRIGIIQLEIIEVKKFTESKLTEIKKVMSDIKKEKKLTHIFLTAIVVEQATNTFVTVDALSQEIVEKSLGVSFQNDIASRSGIMMRKSIIPRILKII